MKEHDYTHKKGVYENAQYCLKQWYLPEHEFL